MSSASHRPTTAVPSSPVRPDAVDPERARTEASLRESEARLQLALEASGMGTFVWHVQDDRVESDSRMLALFGLPATGTLSLKIELDTLIHPDDRARYADAVARATDPAGTGVLREEVRVLHGGDERWLSIMGQTVFEPALQEPTLFLTGPRRAVRMSGMAADITDRKRREANRGFLADLSNDFARLSSPDEIMEIVGQKVGAYLNLSCACLVDVDETMDRAEVAHVWRLDGRPALPKVLRLSAFVTDDFRRASRANDTIVVCDTTTDPRVDPVPFEALKTRSFVSIPFLRNDVVKFVLAVCDEKPRNWREDEVRLCRELSIRLLPRLERARAEAAIANDLHDTLLLRDLSIRLVSEADEHSFFDAIVAAAVTITDARGASIQLLEPISGELAFLAARGLCDTIDQPESGSEPAQFTPLVTRSGRTIGRICTCFERDRRLTERELRFLDLLARQAADLIERRRTDDALRDSERRLSAELADTKLLQLLSAQFIKEQDSMSLYETIVDAATSIMRSEYASLQMLQEHNGGIELRLIASRGFDDDGKKLWEWVRNDNDTTCARALREGVPVTVPDIEKCEAMAGTRDQRLMLAGGIHASHTTPLISRAGRTVGMISTLWNDPHHPTERDLRLLDILARQAADLMERTQAEEALRRNESALKEADRRKDEFLAMLAHELRNPLAPLRTGLELIRLAGDSPASVEEVRTMMEEQVGHMVRLIDDLLDVSRITSGKIRLQCQPTALVTLVNAAVEANQAALGAGHVALSIDLPAVPVTLDVDPTRVVQVLSNILHNAIKFTDPGGRIRIAATLDEGRDDRPEIRIVVSDSGVGITSDMLPRVFDLFTQDEAAARRSGSGLGIGLALARQLVEMHGGTIDVHSDGPGLGSSFTVRLPVALASMAPRTTPSARVPRITRRVVVIDDNVPAANAMKRLVGALGGECAVAYDGESGVASVVDFRPDIVFLDIGMPGMNGYDTCRRIRQEFGSDVVMVALTGWGQERDKQEAVLAGFDLHLAKPADPLILERLLADARPAARSLSTL